MKLLKLGEVKERLDIRNTNEFNKTLIDIITSVTARIQLFLNRDLERKEYSEKFQGGTDFFTLSAIPVSDTDTFSIIINGELVPDDEELYAVDYTNGFIKTSYVVDDDIGSYPIQVNYTGGMVVINDSAPSFTKVWEFNSDTESEYSISGVKSTDWDSYSTHIENKDMLAVSIIPNTKIQLLNQDISGIDISSSGGSKFGIVDQKNNRYTLALDGEFDPSDDQSTWVPFTDLYSITQTYEGLIPHKYIKKHIWHLPEDAGIDRFGVSVYIPVNKSGNIANITLNLNASDYSDQYDDDTTYVPEILRRACEIQVVNEFRRRNDSGLASVQTSDGRIVPLAPGDSLLPEVARILTKLRNNAQIL